MGRKEADYDWKKSTDNIQEVFDFIEVLGSWVRHLNNYYPNDDPLGIMTFSLNCIRKQY